MTVKSARNRRGHWLLKKRPLPATAQPALLIGVWAAGEFDRIGGVTKEILAIKFSRRELPLYSLAFTRLLVSLQNGERINSFNIDSERRREGEAEQANRRREVLVAIEPGDTLVNIAKRWGQLGSSVRLIKEANQLTGFSLEGKSALAVPFFLPQGRDLTRRPHEYRRVAGGLGMFFINLCSRLVPALPSLKKRPRPMPYLPISYAPNGQAAIDYRTLQVEALALQYQTKALICPLEFAGYQGELFLGSQRLGQCFAIIHSLTRGKTDSCQQVALTLKANDAYFSAMEVTEQLKKWGFISDRVGQSA